MVPAREIPGSAVAIKVTNVSSPSCFKIYHKENYTENLNEISNKLRSRMKHGKKNPTDEPDEPRVGDVIIMHNRLETELEVPAWWIRGILGLKNLKTNLYNIFLVDHGFVIQAYREDFTIISKSLIPNEYLTFSVGIHNLIPAASKTENSKPGTNIEIGKNWSNLSIEITRDLVAASDDIYFDYLSVDQDGKKFGEMYLVFDKDIFTLSEILICHEQAIYLSIEFLSLISGKDGDKNTIHKTETGTIIDLESWIIDSPGNHRIRYENETENSGKCTSGLGGKKKLRYVGEECQQILINSKVHCERLANIEDARFPVKIHAALKNLEIHALRRIQSYMWPAVTKGLNVLAIGSPNCGKTIGYILPVASSVASWKSEPRGNNPAVLILCSSTSKVLNANALFKELLQAYPEIRCVAGWNGRPDRSLVADIYNGCRIFIATPAFLLRFIRQDNEHKKLINFDKLSYLVIDGIDVILNKYYATVKELFGKYVKIATRDGEIFTEEPIQIIAVARHWSTLVENFVKECMNDPYICINSYMEAAIFARIKPRLSLVRSDKKMETILDLVEEQMSMWKTIIICPNSKEAHALNDYLCKKKKTLVVCEKMIFTEICAVRECWKASVPGMYPILICSDEVLVDLNITDADSLIHYSVALPSKTQFFFRFSTLMDNLKKGEKKCKVTIVVDETNDVQLYGLISFVKNCGTKISSTFMDNVKRIVASLDREKKMYPICNDVKAFGFCPTKNSCPYRHCVLAGVDDPSTSVKTGDKVKLNVTYVHNATHFTARIMEYVNPNKKVNRYSPGEYTKIASAVQTYFADKSNRRCHRKIKVGDVCAVEESLDNFQRVKVINIVMKDYEEIPLTVELKCIDTGAILPKISVTRLMELPNDLANHDTHIVEVFLVGLVPFDDEYEWNNRAIDSALDWFPDKSQPNSFVLGTVRLHLADTLWVDPLEIRTPIIGYPDLINSSLKPYMLKLKHGQSNKDHLTKLLELCRIGGIGDVEEEINSTTDIGSGNEIDSMSS